ncbi:chromatin accessibility complex protein 1 isoform X2 [Canis lupus familiaris]|uniref:chromatin accessibility complex protein 1 isoform X2 n=1 Tax=Canis lupus familiaris TaxID=9615 RepID=UPI0015F1BDF6|nr:chromatin accessibility complex protein 1 isoform X2 [Canis lupus familiaris]XP_038411538.1 chromatin accessibility complex protein 1 isoform X2 [Canis lupus familiaris]XP_038541048.1 chromatin accessibility complex protein 1 isoform X2 [Canis lupus familiaris]
MADAVAGRDKCGEPRLVSLPLSRIRVIMKSSPEVSSINQEALVLTAKATELFVQYLATYSYRHGSGKERKALTYSDLSNTAEESETFQFLAGVSSASTCLCCRQRAPPPLGPRCSRESTPQKALDQRS